MRDLLLQLAGAVGVVASATHGIIGETQVFPRIRMQPARLLLLMRLVWQCSTIAWMGLAVLLIAAPNFDVGARIWITATSVVVFSLAAAANAWATRGRHFGWVAMAIVAGLAVAGL